MPFFDFHVHPTMKSLFSDPPEKFSPWDILDTSAIPDLLNWCSEFRYILRSQANLNQLWWNECRLVCVALYVPEKCLLKNDLIEGQTKGPLKKYLHKKKIKDIINSTISPYDLLVNDDLKTLLDPAQFGVTDKKIVPLKRASDFDETQKDTVYVVFSVEGCHSFSNSLEYQDVQEVIQHIDDLRQRVPLLSINLTHMEQSSICNHAYGMQFLNHELFRPTGLGLPTEGAAVTKHCYENHIVIDVKHMSLVARQQLYNLRKSPSFLPINQPIICTHAGFTGISINDIPDYIYKTYGKRKGTFRMVMGKPWMPCEGALPAFNSSSINLYNEDIVTILESGGLIGLSLDKRILGYGNPEGKQPDQEERFALEEEYVSAKEEGAFLSRKTGAAFKNGKVIQLKDVREGGNVDPMLAEYHLRHFMAHVVHLVRVARDASYDVTRALTQVCLGSDYDGMINPISTCERVDELVYFKEKFEKCFVDFAKECKVAMPPGFDVKTFSEGLFYKNGKEFVLERLTKLAP